MSRHQIAFNVLADAHRARLGVTWYLGYRNSIMSLRNRGDKGNGAIALREVCALADQLKVTLTLGTSAEKLKPYFETFDFKRTHDIGSATFFKRRPTRIHPAKRAATAPQPFPRLGALMAYRPLPYFIIESAHRGAYVGGDWVFVGARRVWKPRFRWSILRTHDEVFSWRTQVEAERELAKVKAASPSARAYIHEMFAR